MTNRAALLAPSVIARCPVVAVVRLATWPGELPVKVAAITRDENRYNVHVASLVNERAGEWEASQGRYGLTWERALEVMASRATEPNVERPDRHADLRTELDNALAALREAANGDSNDAEIQAGQDVADIAQRLAALCLRRHGDEQ